MPAYSTAPSIEGTAVKQSVYRDSSRTVEYEKRMQDLRHAEKSVRVNGRYVGQITSLNYYSTLAKTSSDLL